MNEHCPICFNLFPKQKLYKYHCNTCKNIICDACYKQHIKISKQCVFCRGDLALPQIKLEPVIKDNSRYIFQKRSTCCWCICFVSFLIFTSITILTKPTNQNKPQFNQTFSS